jgi:hypothetical protein
MAQTKVSYTGDGSAVLFSIPFPYLEESDLLVTVDGGTVAYTFPNSTTVEFPVAPSIGADISIKRFTADASLKATVTAGAAIRAGDLTSNFLQALYKAQEAETLAGDAQAGAVIDGSIGASQLANSAVVTTKIADGAVTTPKIADGSVTNTKIADSAVSTVKIGNSQVTDVKIADSAITSTKLAAGAVTSEKIDTSLSGKTLVNPTVTGTILEGVFTITDGAAFEVDPGNGSIQLITLGANRTPKATNFAAGHSITLMVDDGSGYTLTWTDATWGASGVKWTGGTAPVLATTGYTVLQFWKVGTQVYGALVGEVA